MTSSGSIDEDFDGSGRQGSVVLVGVAGTGDVSPFYHTAADSVLESTPYGPSETPYAE